MLGIASPATGAARIRNPGAPRPLRYVLDLRWDARTRTLAGTETIRLENTGRTGLPSVWIRLWPNGWRGHLHGEPGGCRAPREDISVLSGARIVRYAVRCSAVEVALERPLAPSSAATVVLRFAAHTPRVNDRFGLDAGTNLLGNVVPILAVRDADGWHLDPYTYVGDPGYSLVAAWRAHLVLPANLNAATTGVEISNRIVGERRVIEAATPHARDFALAIGRLRVRETTVNGIELRVFGSPIIPDAAMRHTLRHAREALETYERWYGRYGSSELDVVSGRLPYGGMEYPEIIFTTPDTATVTHEVAHQWWYSIVGDDQYRQPWLDESFASWNEEQFAPGTYNCDPAEPLRDAVGGLALGMSYYERHPAAYWAVIYRGGECALTRLEQDLGRNTFLGLLRTEARRFRYGVVTTRDFLALLKEVSPTEERSWARLVGLP